MNNNRIFKKLLLAIIPMLLVLALSKRTKAQNWSGVDKTVVEKFAEEGGRKAWKPFINTDQGDLLLFVFLVAGAAGGFVLGFYWRRLFYETKKERK